MQEGIACEGYTTLKFGSKTMIFALYMKLHTDIVQTKDSLFGMREMQIYKSLIARFMGPTWGPSGSGRTQLGPHVGPMNFAIWGVDPHVTMWLTNQCLIFKSTGAIEMDFQCQIILPYQYLLPNSKFQNDMRSVVPRIHRIIVSCGAQGLVSI